MYFVVFFPPFFRSDVMPEGLSHLTMDNVQVYFQRMEGVFVYNFCRWKYCYVLINYRFCVLSLHYTHYTYPFWTFGFFPSLSIPYHLEYEYDLTCLLIFITEVFKICHKLMCACSLKFLLIMSHHGSHVLCAHSRARIVWLVKLGFSAKFCCRSGPTFVRKPFWDHFLHSIWSIQSSNCWQKELYWIFYETFQIWNQISH